MKINSTTLVPLSILVVPAMVFGGVYLLCDSVFGLNYPIPVIAAVGTVFALVGAVVWWLARQQKKEDEIVGTLHHPYFGEVRQKRDSWETTMTVPGLGEDLAVSGDGGNLPTENQQATVEWVKGALPHITAELEDAHKELRRGYGMVRPSSIQFVFESLLLDSVKPKTVYIGFDIKDSELPWGFYATFADGKLDEFMDCH